LTFAVPLDLPAEDEVEVSVFGRGVGECIVMHVGGSKWIVVDSHRMAGTKSPPVALEYLEALGVSVASVRVVAATHWDRDHIAGLSMVVQECSDADFMCTGAIADPDFMKQLSLAARHEGPAGPGAKEFREILDILQSRNQGVIWANRLVRRELEPGELRALAPSELTQTNALRRGATDPGRLPKEPTPNATSLVLWFEHGTAAVLLGGDLEVGTDGTGWEGVLATFRPTMRGSVFKVSHHGSDDADHPDVWSQLLEPLPPAVLTPFSWQRPSSDDVVRLKRTSVPHLAGPLGAGRVRRSNHVERIADAQTASGIRRREGTCGHVRLRQALGDAGAWQVTYGAPARAL
jgi:hypothetical protein